MQINNLFFSEHEKKRAHVMSEASPGAICALR